MLLKIFRIKINRTFNNIPKLLESYLFRILQWYQSWFRASLRVGYYQKAMEPKTSCGELLMMMNMPSESCWIP